MVGSSNLIRKPSGGPVHRRVTAVQLPLIQLPAMEQIRESLLAAVLGTAGDKPWLIVLPALTGLLPLHLYAGQWHLPTLATAIRKYGLALEEWWLSWAKAIASQLNVYIVPGSTLIPSEHSQGMLHVSVLINPAGRLMGRAVQTHIRRPLSAWGLMAGLDLPVWTIDGINVGIMLGDDPWYPEVGHILAQQGAQLLVAPTAVPAPYAQWQQRAGPWQQAQANAAFVVEANLTGSIGGDGVDGRQLAGRSAIMAPVDLARHHSGYLQQVGSRQRAGKASVTADLDFTALNKLRAERQARLWPLHQNGAKACKGFLLGSYQQQSLQGDRTVPVGLVVDERFVPPSSEGRQPVPREAKSS